MSNETTILTEEEMTKLSKKSFVKQVYQTENLATKQEREKGYCEVILTSPAKENLIHNIKELAEVLPQKTEKVFFETALELAKKMTKYSWLIVYLTAASPIMDGSFFDDSAIGKDVITPFSSARCSEIGYWNEFIPILNYDSLESYVADIQKYIADGLLKSASELYYPIRLKPHGANSIENLEKAGVNHIELRMLDLNPLSPVGIFKEDIDFLHMLILYLTSLKDENFSESEQICAIKNIKQASKYDDENTLISFDSEKIPVKSAALNVLCDMQKFFEKYNQEKALNIIDYQKNKICDKSKRYVEIIRKSYSKNYVENGIHLSLKYADRSD